MRMAAFLLSWALLQQDEYAAAVATRKAYTDLVNHIHDLAAVSMGYVGTGAWVEWARGAYCKGVQAACLTRVSGGIGCVNHRSC